MGAGLRDVSLFTSSPPRRCPSDTPSPSGTLRAWVGARENCERLACCSDVEVQMTYVNGRTLSVSRGRARCTYHLLPSCRQNSVGGERTGISLLRGYREA